MLSPDFFDDIRILSRVLCSPPCLIDALCLICDFAQVLINWWRRDEYDPRVMYFQYRMVNDLDEVLSVFSW